MITRITAFSRLSPILLQILALALLIPASISLADTTTQSIPFSQDWSNTGLITTNDDWSGVSGIVGYRGDGLVSSTGVDPQTVLGDGSATPVDVNANQTNPNTFTTGGVSEFEITDPVVALQGSGTADAPHIVIYLNTTGQSNITISYNLRDIDGAADNAVQQVALQYRVGNSGNFTNIPAGYIADATTGPSLATLVTPVNVLLPSAVDNQAEVQIRVITTDAAGSDEWVGIDDISITAAAGDIAPSVLNTTPVDGATNVALDANIDITFSEAINVGGSWFDITCGSSGTHTANSSGGPTTFTLDPDTDFANSETCTVTVLAAEVTDQDSDDPPDNLAADYVFSFDTVGAVVAPPDIIITEIMYDPNSAEDNWEWIEIYNAGSEAVDLTGFVVDDNNGTAHGAANIAGGNLAAGAQAILYNVDDVSAADFAAAWGAVNLIPVTNWSALSLNNTGDQVSLWASFADYSGDNTTHANAFDTVNYGGGGFPDPVGASIYLTNLGADNNVGSNWATSTTGGATPLFSGYQSLAAGGNIGTDIGSPGTPDTPPIPPFDTCGDPATLIHDVQGNGSASPLVGNMVVVEGVVVSNFQGPNQIGGYHVQEQDADADANPLTSEGIHVLDNSNTPGIGDVVRVQGTVAENFGLTRLQNIINFANCGGGGVATTATVSLPILLEDDFEAFEGMLVTFPQSLTISEYFNFDRFGEIVLTTDRRFQATAQFEPGSPDAAQAMQDFLLNRITLDDGRGNQNPDPAIHPNGGVFDLTNLFRGGDTVANVTGVMDFAFGLYRIQPTQGADYASLNPRTAQPDNVGGNLKVASFNVLNYFTTIDTGAFICGPAGNQECRGADDATEFTRQRDKIISALAAINADVVGLIEIENHPADVPTADLVSGLNAVLGAGTYDYIVTGAIGTDAIRVALIYKPATVTPVGSYAVLDTSVDPRFLDNFNRPALAQSFKSNATGAVFTVTVNHLKSKGSDCNAIGDPDTGDGSGNCNLTRKAAAEALVDWLATDPTGSGDPDFLIIGDLNSYDKEDPIDAIQQGSDDALSTGDDYTDLIFHFNGEFAYSYVFDGQSGYLDHALANADLLGQVSGVTEWHINSDEPDLIDYDTSFKQPAQDAIYAPDAYRSSDHDPVIVGLSLVPECNGQNATVYVNADGKIVGGIHHGKTYNGRLYGKLGDVDDVIVGTNGSDKIFGLNGDDLICGRDGNDHLLGNVGSDTIFGEGGNDLLWGGLLHENDYCDGGVGHDLAFTCKTKVNIP
ncbi:MAG TPA: ExeM/NucH family extracellular endonuclease [Anaerolineae bacterium]